MFIKKGFFSASLADITEAAGHTRGAFYSNFNDKSDLLIESLRRNRDDRSLHAILELSQNIYNDELFALWVEATLLANFDSASRERFNQLMNETMANTANHAAAAS